MWVNISYLNFSNNNLSCIEVDNDAYSDAKWSYIKDETAFFSENCVTPIFDLPTSICLNSEVPILKTISDNDISGTWSPSAIDTSLVGTQDYIFTPSQAGVNTYRITITVISAPDIPSGETEQTFTQGQTLADLVVNGNNLVWYSDVALTIEIPNTTALVHNTAYYVVEAAGNCKSLALAIKTTDVASRLDFGSYGFSFYPNPVNDVLHFSSNQPVEKVEVSNLLGQTIKINANPDNTSIDLSQGNYLVKVEIEGISKIVKVVKK